MNENLNLVEILKDCPKGTKLYSTIYGEVELDAIDDCKGFPVRFVKSDGLHGSVTAQGMLLMGFGECTLFPSREERNWSKFKVKKPKFDPKILRPFDKVLIRDRGVECWRCALYSHTEEQRKYKYVTTKSPYRQCIPYNDDTEHLVGTTKEAPEFYRYWEE